MEVTMKAIGRVRTEATSIPRHWSVSDVEGWLEIEQRYEEGLQDIQVGDSLVVLFWFHKSAPFTPAYLRQKPPHRSRKMGVFSICSPVRPNPIGLSVVEVLAVEGSRLKVKGLDMYDGTPILDLKPFKAPPEESRDCSA